MNRQLIAFAGRIASGKDTAAMYLVRKHNFVKYGFADPLKRCVCAAFGWDIKNMENRSWKEETDPLLGFSPRRALQVFGTECGRHLAEDVWVRLAGEMWGQLQSAGRGMAICDLRFDNEAEWVKEQGGKVVVMLRTVEGVEEQIGAHASEQGIREDLVDYYFHNDGSKDHLYAMVEDIL